MKFLLDRMVAPGTDAMNLDAEPDRLGRYVPVLREVPEGLVFRVGTTRYAKVGQALLNLATGTTVDARAFLLKRAARAGLVKALLKAVGGVR